jgi:hypothetical protein
MSDFYCPEHRYNPPLNSGFSFCPMCEAPEAYTTVSTPEMNALQDAGIISDNCVTWADVADVDKERALKWLAVHKGELL